MQALFIRQTSNSTNWEGKSFQRIPSRHLKWFPHIMCLRMCFNRFSHNETTMIFTFWVYIIWVKITTFWRIWVSHHVMTILKIATFWRICFSFHVMTILKISKTWVSWASYRQNIGFRQKWHFQNLQIHIIGSLCSMGII